MKETKDPLGYLITVTLEMLFRVYVFLFSLCLFFFWQCVILYGHFMQLSTYPAGGLSSVILACSVYYLHNQFKHNVRKPYLLTCTPNKDSNQPVHLQSDQSLRSPHENFLHFRLSKMRPMRISIRLRQCWAYMYEVTLPDVVYTSIRRTGILKYQNLPCNWYQLKVPISVIFFFR